MIASHRFLVAGAILATSLTAQAAPEPPPDPKAIEFFEAKVRPILVESCISCHGPKKQQASLRLDSREGLLRGSDNGLVVVPGKPDESRLLKVVRHQGSVKMPPKEKLKPEAIDALADWVKLGVPWPTEVAGTAKPPSQRVAELRQQHWAFQPVKAPQQPPVKNPAWVRSPVDAFVLAELEQKGLAPATPADKRILLRRVTFDLIGLPPTPEEVAAFEADAAPDAFTKVVDRLLASPLYGERWGRHWLDVARYADTKGYVFTEERRFPYSYTYRDYVIAAFNDDKPYDRFVLEQLAADQVPLGDDKHPLAAMGYLTLGRRFLNNTHDIIDDRIDVVMRGLQGLTVTCARCHDHKFDPIPTKDYYSLYGVFASSMEPKELPLLVMPQENAAFLAYEKELHTREQKVAEFVKAKHAELTARFRAHVADYLLAVRDAHLLPGEEHDEEIAADDLPTPMVRRWQKFLDETKKKHHPVFAPWVAFAALPQKEFAAKAPELAQHLAANADPQRRINPRLAQAFAGPPPATLRAVAKRYADLFAEVDKEWQAATQRGETKLADADLEQLRQVLYGDGSPLHIPPGEIYPFMDRATQQKQITLQRDVDHFKVTAPAAPPRGMILHDTPAPVQPRILLRGNPNTPGPVVPRQYLEVLARDERKPFAKGSGRLELAQAIASKDNPLTARVMANRIWHWHFGAGIVRTPSDFGLRGEPPTHPELLDYLAWSFMENGWSMKKLHRLILLSSTYQQSSAADTRLTVLDPDNLLLARVARHRLDFEAMRDSLLHVAGRLDPTRGGAAVEITTAPFSTRRPVYGFIDRQNLPGLFRTFDFAGPDTTSPQRFTTTVPQQALFLMNSPFVVEQAHQLANRPDVLAKRKVGERIEHLYLLCYGRKPDAEELALGLDFLEEASKERSLPAWDKYAQVLLLANEFAFVD
jgi:hypothetical protein